MKILTTGTHLYLFLSMDRDCYFNVLTGVFIYVYPSCNSHNHSRLNIEEVTIYSVTIHKSQNKNS